MRIEILSYGSHRTPYPRRELNLAASRLGKRLGIKIAPTESGYSIEGDAWKTRFLDPASCLKAVARGLMLESEVMINTRFKYD